VKKAYPHGAWGQNSTAALAQKASVTSAPAGRTGTMERGSSPPVIASGHEVGITGMRFIASRYGATRATAEGEHRSVAHAPDRMKPDWKIDLSIYTVGCTVEHIGQNPQD
jgi:hypothetical protein